MGSPGAVTAPGLLRYLTDVEQYHAALIVA